jgi:hypothetical protein
MDKSIKQEILRIVIQSPKTHFFEISQFIDRKHWKSLPSKPFTVAPLGW